MVKYWITPSLEELIDWHANAGDADEIEVTFKCSVDEITDRVYRSKGLHEVNRQVMEALFTTEQLDQVEADTRSTRARLQESGVYELAKDELDQAGIF